MSTFNADKYREKLARQVDETAEWYGRQGLEAAPLFKQKLESWVDQTFIPEVVHLRTGETVVVLPHYNYRKRQNQKGNKQKRRPTLRRRSSTIFYIQENGHISIHKLEHGDRGGNGFFKALRLKNGNRYVRRRALSYQAYPGTRLSHKEFLQLFTQPEKPAKGPIIGWARRKNRFHLTRAPQLEELDRRLTRLQRTALQIGAAELLSALDPGAVEIIHKARSLNAIADYNWLSGDVTPEVSEYRLGAGYSYPGLIPLFHEKGADGTQLTESIDDGNSVPKALRKVFGKHAAAPLHKNLYRPLHGVPQSRTGIGGQDALRKNSDILDMISPSDFPQDETAWHSLNHLSGYFRTFGRITGQPLPDIVGTIGLDPAFFAKNDLDNSDMTELRDFVRELYKVVALPLLVQVATRNGVEFLPERLYNRGRHGDRTDLLHQLLSPLTPKQIARGAKQWHDRIITYQAELAGLNIHSMTSWEPLSRNITTPSGVTITPLISQADLDREGRELGHCVRLYASHCAGSNHHILSLSGNEGTQRSTLELVETYGHGEDAPALSIQQHKSFRNRIPSDLLREAAQWYIVEIHNGRITVDWDQIAKTRSEINATQRKEKLERHIGFDPYDHEKHEQAFDALKQYVPGAMQRMSLAQFIKASDIESALRKALCLEPTPPGPTTNPIPQIRI